MDASSLGCLTRAADHRKPSSSLEEQQAQVPSPDFFARFPWLEWEFGALTVPSPGRGPVPTALQGVVGVRFSYPGVFLRPLWEVGSSVFSGYDPWQTPCALSFLLRPSGMKSRDGWGRKSANPISPKYPLNPKTLLDL